MIGNTMGGKAGEKGATDERDEVKSWDNCDAKKLPQFNLVSPFPTPTHGKQYIREGLAVSSTESSYVPFIRGRTVSGSEECDGDKDVLLERKRNLAEQSVLPRVLVVDDAVSNRKMLSRLLRSRCRSVEEAADGQEALKKVLESLLATSDLQYDIILMDFVMPVMDGPTATEEIRRAGFTGLIFGLTGNVLESDIEFFIAHGANYVLTKPFEAKLYDKLVIESRKYRYSIATKELVSGR